MTNGDPALLIVAIGSAKNDRPIEDLDRLFEIDAMLGEVYLALPSIPIESSKGFMVEFL